MSTRVRLSRPESKVLTRSRLLAAAREAFLESGFHGASLSAIADDAGYTVGALYSNFDGKAGLFLAVFADYAAERARELEQINAETSAPRQPASVADQWMAKLADEPKWFPLFVEFAATAAHEPALRDQLAASLVKVRNAGVELLSRRTDNYPLSDLEMATAIKALGNGLALERMIDPDAVPDDLYARFLVSLFRAG